MKVFLPYRSEFGFLCMFHAPWVNAFPSPKTVIIEEGTEALYPGCEYLYLDRRKDADRRARPEKDVEKEWRERIGDGVEFLPMPYPATKATPRRYFVPSPYRMVRDASRFDVCVCPRKREYGSNKNWPYWQHLTDALLGMRMKVFAAGHPESSYLLTGCRTAWDRSVRYLDETIQGMLNSNLVVATDAGLAHLALMCGKPLVLITHKEGMVAPGTDDIGKDYWPIYIDRYHEENHLNAPIHQVYYGWEGTGRVVEKIEESLRWVAPA